MILLHPTFDRLSTEHRDFAIDGVRVQHVAQMHVYGEASAGVLGERRRFSAGQLLQVSTRATLAKRGLQTGEIQKGRS